MKSYLLDTNIVNYWHNAASPHHAAVVARINALQSDDFLFISVVTLGEIEFGHRRAERPDAIQQEEFRAFLKNRFPYPLSITRDTVEYYGDIRSRLFMRYPPQGKKQRRPEACYDTVNSRELGIDENDLWIAAQAAERKLILVTNDSMTRIRETIRDFVDIEDWVNPTSA